MVRAERRQLHVVYFQQILGITNWQVGFIKISPQQVTNEKIRSNNKLVALAVEDPLKKQATIYHTRKEVTREDIAHELVHLAHPDWKDHKRVEAETQRIKNLKS